MTSKRVQALVLAAAVAGGYAGAAAYSAWALPSVAVATDFGPGDGLTRYVLTAVLRRRRRPAGRADRHGRRGQCPAAERRPRPGGHERAAPADPRGAARASPTPSSRRPCPCSAPSPTRTSPSTATTWTTPGPTPTTSRPRPWPTPTSTPPRAGPAEPATAGSSPSSTPATTPTTRSSRARCGPTRPSPAARPTPTATARPATATAGTSRPTRPTSTTAPTASTARASPASSAAGRATAWAPPAWPRTSRSCRWSSAAARRVDVTLGAEAIRYAVDHGADVINASWGGAFAGWPLDNLESAIAYAAAHDVLVVAAAGNDAANRDTLADVPGEPARRRTSSPSATRPPPTGSAPFSAYGATSVDLFAPGDLVFTTWNDGGYRLVSGTSIAAPQVAAAYALYRAAWPDATARRAQAGPAGRRRPGAGLRGQVGDRRRLSIGSLADGALGAVRYTFTSMTAPGRRRRARHHRDRGRRQRRLLRRARPRHGAGRRGLGAVGQGADARRHHADHRRLR